MEWHLEWGAKAEAIIKAAGPEADKLPFVQARVDPEPYLVFEWVAFQDLARDRPRGFGAAPIPWSSIDRYAARYGIHDIDKFDRFATLIKRMDAVVLSREQKPEA